MAIAAPAVAVNHLLIALKQGLVGRLPMHDNVKIRKGEYCCGRVCSPSSLLSKPKQMVHEEEGSSNGA